MTVPLDPVDDEKNCRLWIGNLDPKVMTSLPSGCDHCLIFYFQSPLSVPVPVPLDPVDDENNCRLWIGNLDPKVTE